MPVPFVTTYGMEPPPPPGADNNVIASATTTTTIGLEQQQQLAAAPVSVAIQPAHVPGGPASYAPRVLSKHDEKWNR